MSYVEKSDESNVLLKQIPTRRKRAYETQPKRDIEFRTREVYTGAEATAWIAGNPCLHQQS